MTRYLIFVNPENLEVKLVTKDSPIFIISKLKTQGKTIEFRDSFSEILNKRKSIEQSEHIFFIIEDNISFGTLKKIKPCFKNGNKVYSVIHKATKDENENLLEELFLDLEIDLKTTPQSHISNSFYYTLLDNIIKDELNESLISEVNDFFEFDPTIRTKFEFVHKLYSHLNKKRFLKSEMKMLNKVDQEHLENYLKDGNLQLLIAKMLDDEHPNNME